MWCGAHSRILDAVEKAIKLTDEKVSDEKPGPKPLIEYPKLGDWVSLTRKRNWSSFRVELS